MGLREKLYDFRDRLKDRHMFSIVIALLAICILLGVYIYKKQNEYRQASENDYNLAFYQVVDYVQNVQNYLAKALVTTSAERSGETLVNVWREANLANTYLAQLPLQVNEIENTSKFLNQVSDYSYSLSKKNMNGENLTDEDYKNLQNLHKYSIDLENSLNQLAEEINSGNISWGELNRKARPAFAKQVNVSQDSFKSITNDFKEYEGLIYDGAFSEHINQGAKKALSNNEISEEDAKNKIKQYINESQIKEIKSNGLIENNQISAYDFTVKTNDDSDISISITKQDGFILSMNSNREVKSENISDEEANSIGKRYLEEHGFTSMKETYFLKQNGMITINYAYLQDNVVIYPDLIKVKIALDNGQVMGIETMGYLNSHYKRDISKIKLSKEDAKAKVNKNLNIQSEGLAIIPTEWNTEILCYEFKGKVDETEFLIYINAENGKEENSLVIINTPNGTLTM